jgi:hypothetical protein
MRREALKLTARHRRWFYVVVGVLFLSGVGWLAVHFWPGAVGEFGAPHPAETWLLKTHGAAAMATLILFGTLLPIHVRRGWRARLNRSAGLAILAVSVLLAASGYALYYAGGAWLRNVAKYVHDGLGLLFPVILWWHIASGRRAVSEPQSTKPRPNES